MAQTWIKQWGKHDEGLTRLLPCERRVRRAPAALGDRPATAPPPHQRRAASAYRSHCSGLSRHGIATDGQPYQNSYAWIMKLADGMVIDGTAFFDSISFNDLWVRVQP